VFVVESDEEVDGGVVDHFAVDAVGETVQERLQDDFITGVGGGGVLGFVLRHRCHLLDLFIILQLLCRYL
jgi:hypothetical protein